MPEFIEGHGAVFYDPDEAGSEFRLWEYVDNSGESIEVVERIDEGAFDAALSRPDNVRGLYNHNPDHLLGTVDAGTLELDTDEKGLRYKIPYDDGDPDHQRVASKMERGDLVGSSFAFTIDGEKWERMGNKDVRTITDLTLYDVGPVTYPAYTAADSGSRDVRRFVDQDGLPMECRSDSIGNARESWTQWQVEKREQVTVSNVTAPPIATVTPEPTDSVTITIEADERKRLANDWAAGVETLKRRLRFFELNG